MMTTTSPDPIAAPVKRSTFRREKWVVGGLLAALTLTLSALLGVWLGGRLAEGPAPRLAGSDQEQRTLAWFQQGPAVKFFGPGVEFVPSNFPADRFAYTPPPPSDEAAAGDGERDGDVIQETPASEPVKLLGGDSSTLTADSSSGDPEEVFFGQEPPAPSSPPVDLFDLGASSNPSPKPQESEASERYTLSLGTFDSRANADLLARNLKDAGFAASVTERTRDDGTVQFRVYSGRYNSKQEAEAAQQAMAVRSFEAWLVKG